MVSVHLDDDFVTTESQRLHDAFTTGALAGSALTALAGGVLTIWGLKARSPLAAWIAAVLGVGLAARVRAWDQMRLARVDALAQYSGQVAGVGKEEGRADKQGITTPDPNA